VFLALTGHAAEEEAEEQAKRGRGRRKRTGNDIAKDAS